MNTFTAPNKHQNNAPASKADRRIKKQRGDMLVNIGIALAIMTLLAIVGMPAIKGWVIEGRVPQVAGEMQRMMARMRVMGETGVATPFATVTNEKNLIPALRGSTIVRINETANEVAHNLGGNGRGTNGTVVIAAANYESYGSGSAYQLTFTNVHDKACPTLASMLASASEFISINGNTVKENSEAAIDTTYNAVDAQTHCVDGEENTFVFMSR